MSDQSAPPEIVIVRRRSSEEEGHHGGVWKIAYADFVTAMMAFFLVMWLVNASDKKVLTQVASYFNPLKMSDRVTSAKGVEEMTEGSRSRSKTAEAKADEEAEASAAKDEHKAEKDHKTQQKAAKDGKSDAEPREEPPPSEHEAKPAKADPAGLTDLSEQELFNDPYGILEKLAASVQARPEKKGETVAAKEDSGGTAFRDPFDPDFNRLSKNAGAQELGAGKGQAPQPEPADAKANDTRRPKVSEKGEVKTAEGASSQEQRDTALKSLQAEVERELGKLGPGERPSIQMTETSEGILISLTDEFDFEMFRIGSAQPNPRTVAAMRRIGTVLQTTSGAIVVRGHTDSRKFKQKTSDNWLLSSERALMSRYMLVSGGLSEKRVEKIEGYADTVPKVPENGLAAQNRRIEILIRKAEMP